LIDVAFSLLTALSFFLHFPPAAAAAETIQYQKAFLLLLLLVVSNLDLSASVAVLCCLCVFVHEKHFRKLRHLDESHIIHQRVEQKLTSTKLVIKVHPAGSEVNKGQQTSEMTVLLLGCHCDNISLSVGTDLRIEIYVMSVR